jgi:hypothetical protein
MPDAIDYDETNRRLVIGAGYIENVPPEVWRYSVSGKQVLRQWFSYRKKSRERPIIGDRRPPSPLGDIQPDHWLAEYTTELIDVLHVLGRLVELEPLQADLLERICAGTPTRSGRIARRRCFCHSRKLPHAPVNDCRAQEHRADVTFRRDTAGASDKEDCRIGER